MFSYDKLHGLLAHLETLDDEPAQWLVKGINKTLESGENLDKSLGLHGLRYRYLKKKRNDFIYQAWLLLPENVSPWKRSSKLANMIYRFESRCWRRLQHHGQPPEHLDQIEALIFQALKTGLRLPSSIKQIHNIVQGNLKGVHIS